MLRVSLQMYNGFIRSLYAHNMLHRRREIDNQNRMQILPHCKHNSGRGSGNGICSSRRSSSASGRGSDSGNITASDCGRGSAVLVMVVM